MFVLQVANENGTTVIGTVSFEQRSVGCGTKSPVLSNTVDVRLFCAH